MQLISTSAFGGWKRAALVLWGLAMGVAHAQDPYVLYIDGYPAQSFYLARLAGLEQPVPPQAMPRPIRMTQSVGSLGNPDVSRDGRKIVFPAISQDDWNIYTGTLDVARREIRDIKALVGQKGVREEDPRYSWDGRDVVYKCDGRICLHSQNGPVSNPVVAMPGCELWGPSFHPWGRFISFTARCGLGDSDRIRIADLYTGQVVDEVSNTVGGPDRYSHFLADGTLAYAHEDPSSGDASLWIYNPASKRLGLFLNRTVSDADPYANKSDARYMAFSGYQRGYNLYVFRGPFNDTVRLTSRTTVLGPVIFNLGQ